MTAERVRYYFDVIFILVKRDRESASAIHVLSPQATPRLMLRAICACCFVHGKPAQANKFNAGKIKSKIDLLLIP